MSKSGLAHATSARLLSTLYKPSKESSASGPVWIVGGAVVQATKTTLKTSAVVSRNVELTILMFNVSIFFGGILVLLIAAWRDVANSELYHVPASDLH